MLGDLNVLLLQHHADVQFVGRSEVDLQILDLGRSWGHWSLIVYMGYAIDSAKGAPIWAATYCMYCTVCKKKRLVIITVSKSPLY